MGSNLRSTYKDLAQYYLREARSCEDACAYRMAIVAAATSAHMAGYFILLAHKYVEKEKAGTFEDVRKQIEQIGKWKKIERYMKSLQEVRNAIMHPNEWVVPKWKKGEGETTVSMKIKSEDLPVEKKKINFISIIDSYRDLSQIARDSIEEAEKVHLCLLGIVEPLSTLEYKKLIEEKFSNSGRSIRLEDI